MFNEWIQLGDWQDNENKNILHLLRKRRRNYFDLLQKKTEQVDKMGGTNHNDNELQR